MIRVLEVKYPKYAALAHERFSQHSRAFRALGATGPIFQIADQVNKVRVELAHSKKGARTKLSEEDLKELCSQASGAFGGLKDVLEFRIIRSGEDKELRDFPMAHQFAIVGFMAAAAIDTIPQREAAALGQFEMR